jgi:hypothetical protein
MDEFALIFFSCQHELTKCMWDFLFSVMLRCVTSQKSEELMYTVPEAWKHANSMYIMLFDSACSWGYSSPYYFIFFVYLYPHLFVCSAISWKFYPFRKLWCMSLATFLFFGKELISWNISLLFFTVSVPVLFCGNFMWDVETRLWNRRL